MYTTEINHNRICHTDDGSNESRNAYLVIILCRETFRLSIFVLDLLLGNGQICFEMYLCNVNCDSPLDFIFHIDMNCDWGL